jgi:hypothetical protein
MIGDILNYGFDSKFQTVFMDVEIDINSIYLIYRDNLVIASNYNLIDKLFVSDLVDEYHILNISGTKELIDQLDNIRNWRKQDCYFASLKHIEYEVDTTIVQQLKPDDTAKLVAGLNTVFHIETKLDVVNDELNDKTARHYVIYNDEEEIITHAGTTAECEGLAMIIGVFTMAGYRKKHNAIKCVSKLCSDLLKENKTPCLFYSNPDAAKMYKMLGFKDVGEFTLLKKG